MSLSEPAADPMHGRHDVSYLGNRTRLGRDEGSRRSLVLLGHSVFTETGLKAGSALVQHPNTNAIIGYFSIQRH